MKNQNILQVIVLSIGAFIAQAVYIGLWTSLSYTVFLAPAIDAIFKISSPRFIDFYWCMVLGFGLVLISSSLSGAKVITDAMQGIGSDK